MMKKNLLSILALSMALISANAQTSINDDFFEKVPYIGAFGSTDWTSGWANFDCQNTAYGATTVNVSGEISGSVKWTSDKVYLLQGFVYVVDGATLTIEPGTVIRGEKSSKGSLIVEPGARIMAEGTMEKPIVFTSNEAAGSRVRGDWGGLVLCGKAPINVTGGTSQIEGGPRTTYGGTDVHDNSGVLKYLRVEFAGYPFEKDKEINGITFGGVGDGTTIEYCQVSYSNDDSYEWFGGTVNAKHLIAYRGLDDEFDTDFGFSGHIQFIVGLRDSAVADISGSNGFESDNDAKGSDNTPQTSTVFSNVSLFGPKASLTNPFNPLFKRAMHIRRNSSISVYNSIFAGWPIGLCIDGSKTEANALSKKTLHIENTIISGSKASSFFTIGVAGTTAADSIARLAAVRTWFLSDANNNDTLATNDLLELNDPFNYASPNFLPKSNAKILNAGKWAATGVSITSPDNKTEIKSNGTLQLTATVSPVALDVVWSIESGAEFASVSESGLVIAIKAGSVVVKAALKDVPAVSSTFTITVNSEVAVNFKEGASEMIYPNPFVDKITYRMPTNVSGNAKIEIVDITGKVVAKLYNGNVNGSENLTFDVNLNEGIYFTRLTINGESTINKIVRK